jgi:hypothetical protein
MRGDSRIFNSYREPNMSTQFIRTSLRSRSRRQNRELIGWAIATCILGLSVTTIAADGFVAKIIAGDETPVEEPSLDRWRRTSLGWEQLEPAASPKRKFVTAQHISFVQIWPAAWAACVVLSVLAASGAEGIKFNTGTSGRDQVS